MYDILEITFINEYKQERYVNGLENLLILLSGILNDIPFFKHY